MADNNNGNKRNWTELLLGDKRKKWYKRWQLWVIGLLLMSAFESYLDASGWTEENEARKQEEREEKDEERRIKKEERAQAKAEKEALEKEQAEKAQAAEAERRAALTVLERINEDLDGISAIKKYDEEITDITFNEIGGVVILELFTHNAASAKTERNVYRNDAAKIFEVLFAEEDIQSATINWNLPLVDKYGNSEMAYVMRIELKREEADKINWDRFIPDNFESIASQYFLHPALRD